MTVDVTLWVSIFAIARATRGYFQHNYFAIPSATRFYLLLNSVNDGYYVSRMLLLDIESNYRCLAKVPLLLRLCVFRKKLFAVLVQRNPIMSTVDNTEASVKLKVIANVLFGLIINVSFEILSALVTVGLVIMACTQDREFYRSIAIMGHYS